MRAARFSALVTLSAVLLLGAPAFAQAPAKPAAPAAKPATVKPVKPVPTAYAAPGLPPQTWKEHWFEHDRLMKRVASNEEVAVYFDEDVPAQSADWLVPFLTKLWRYTKAAYGPFPAGELGGGRLFALFHQVRYGGGHLATYFDASHDFRNVSDCGPGPWERPQYDMASHEVAHIVEGASRGVHGSPAWEIWRDSKWAEFYQYDVYVALGMDAEAKRVYEKFTNTSDDFPRPGTRWFRDWFFPLWRDHGRARVMARFFELASHHYPKAPENDGRNVTYTRRMNWGEYIHFMSGAAGKDLRPLAKTAFGWPPEWEAQHRKARVEFRDVRY